MIAIIRSSPNALKAEKAFHVLKRLDQEHYIVAFPTNLWEQLAQNFTLASVNHFWKLSDAMRNDTKNEPIHCVVKSKAPELTLISLKQNGNITIIGMSGQYIQLFGKRQDLLNKLLPRNEIHFMGKESFYPKLESSVIDLNPSINNIPKFQNALDSQFGNSMILGLKDNSTFSVDIDLIDKIFPSPLASSTEDQHATDMATIIAGLGNSSVKGRGISPNSKIQLSDFKDLFPDAPNQLSQNGVFVQNHSYGTEVEHFYGVLAEAYDRHVHENPTQLHIFSAGNAGEQVPTEGTYAGQGTFANLTGNFKMAKNILTIGAVDETYQRMPFSSRGPAFDGRIKPELTAYSIVGTSNATAITTAIAGLLQENYQSTFDSSPPASLIKALLINGADDIAQEGPDFDTGYGNINALKALKILQEEHFLVDSIAGDTPKIYTITIPPQAQNIKVTVVWTDVPANANDAIALVNDLDLVVRDAGQAYLPWVLEGHPNQSPAQPGIDRLNTIEQVFLPNPSTSLQIEVSAFSLDNNTQEFALAYSWELPNSFVWNYPLNRDNLPYDGETPTYLRWDSNILATNGEISVSYDNGQLWESIGTNVPFQQGYYLWIPPEELHTTALVKISDGLQEFISDPFLISRSNQLTLGLNCEDSFELQWNPSPNAEAYTIYGLTGTELQPLAQIQDTTYAVEKAQDVPSYFSVQPLFSDGVLGVRSKTINTEGFPSNCYDSFLFPEADLPNVTIEVQAVLTSVLDVSRLVLEKKTGVTFTRIDELSNPNSLRLQFLDEFPVDGANTYRLKTVLTDGSEFLSEETQLVFLSETPFLTFPNPVIDGINIISRDVNQGKSILSIFGLDGRLILSEELPAEQNFIGLESLPSGTYAMVLVSGSGARYSKLITKR